MIIMFIMFSQKYMPGNLKSRYFFFDEMQSGPAMVRNTREMRFVRSRQQWKLVGAILYFSFISSISHRELEMLCVIASNKYTMFPLLYYGYERSERRKKWIATLFYGRYSYSVLPSRCSNASIIANDHQQIIAFYLKIINRLTISFGAYLLSYYVIMKWDASTRNQWFYFSFAFRYCRTANLMFFFARPNGTHQSRRIVLAKWGKLEHGWDNTTINRHSVEQSRSV